MSTHFNVHILKCQEIHMTDWSCCSALTIDDLNLTNDCLTLLNWLTDPAEVTDWFCWPVWHIMLNWLTDPAELTDWSCWTDWLILLSWQTDPVELTDWSCWTDDLHWWFSLVITTDLTDFDYWLGTYSNASLLEMLPHLKTLQLIYCFKTIVFYRQVMFKV